MRAHPGISVQLACKIPVDSIYLNQKGLVILRVLPSELGRKRFEAQEWSLARR